MLSYLRCWNEKQRSILLKVEKAFIEFISGSFTKRGPIFYKLSVLLLKILFRIIKVGRKVSCL